MSANTYGKMATKLFAKLRRNSKETPTLVGRLVNNLVAIFSACFCGNNDSTRKQRRKLYPLQTNIPCTSTRVDNIESINVLKGAAASALYGSRAAGGVIVITTKSGKSGVRSNKGLEMTFNASYAIEEVANLIEIQELVEG